MNALTDSDLGWSALAVSIMVGCDINESFERLFNPPKCNEPYRRSTHRNVLDDELTQIMREMREVQHMEYEQIGKALGVSKWCVFKRLKRLKERETA